MKPYVHAESSVKKYKGKISDYLPIHQWFDETKAHYPTNVHRALRHHSMGIFECERVFGTTITNSDGLIVCTRDLGEQHVLEDLGFIPTVSDYLNHLEHQDWMSNKGTPPNTPAPNVVKLPKPEEQIYDGTQPQPFRTPLDDRWPLDYHGRTMD